MKRLMRIPVLALVLLGAACSSAMQPAGPPPFDPVGTYDFSTTVEGTTVAGVLTVRRNPDGTLAASMSTPVTGEVALRTITVEGRSMEFRTSIEGDALLMRMDVAEDNRITGGWELSSGMSGAVTGSRRAG